MARNNQVFTDIHSLDQEGVKKFAKFTIKTGTNMMILGPAGSGKTEMGIQSAEELDYDWVYLNLAVLEAPDLLGLPMVDEATKTSNYALPSAFPRRPTNAVPGRKGKILIVDEIDKAKPELQNPMLELFQFRSINGVKLDFDAVLATGNRPDEGAFSMPVSKALTNRCKMYQLTPKFDPWRDYAVSVGLNSLIIGFLSRNVEYFLKPNTSGDATAYCSPSPRSWSYAGKDLDFAQKDGVQDYTFLNSVISGYVGVEAAAKFQVWLEYYQEIGPMVDQLIHSGKKPNTSDLTFDKIVVSAIHAMDRAARSCEAEVPDAKEIEKVQKIVANVSSWIKTLTPDVQIAAVKSTVQMKKIQMYKLIQVPEFMEIFRSIDQART